MKILKINGNKSRFVLTSVWFYDNNVRFTELETINEIGSIYTSAYL